MVNKINEKKTLPGCIIIPGITGVMVRVQGGEFESWNGSQISPTFYEQLLHQYSFAKKLQSQTVNREKLCTTLSYEKAARKMLVKVTPGFSSMVGWQTPRTLLWHFFEVICDEYDPECEKRLLQYWHWNGLSPVWMRTCSWKNSYSFRHFQTQWKPLNVITLSQTQSNNINRMITITDKIYLFIFNKWDY